MRLSLRVALTNTLNPLVLGAATILVALGFEAFLIFSPKKELNFFETSLNNKKFLKISSWFVFIDEKNGKKTSNLQVFITGIEWVILVCSLYKMHIRNQVFRY